MNGDDGLDDARRAKRERDAAGARRRRANRRIAREAAWAASQAPTSTTAGDGRDGAATGGQTTGGVVVYLPGVRHSSLLDEHIRRAAHWLSLCEADPRIGVAEKARLFVAAIPALAKGVEAVEFVERLAAVERRLDARERRG